MYVLMKISNLYIDVWDIFDNMFCEENCTQCIDVFLTQVFDHHL